MARVSVPIAEAKEKAVEVCRIQRLEDFIDGGVPRQAVCAVFFRNFTRIGVIGRVDGGVEEREETPGVVELEGKCNSLTVGTCYDVVL